MFSNFFLKIKKKCQATVSRKIQLISMCVLNLNRIWCHSKIADWKWCRCECRWFSAWIHTTPFDNHDAYDIFITIFNLEKKKYNRRINLIVNDSIYLENGLEIAEFLIKHGADLKMASNDGMTPLHRSIQMGK